MIDKLYRKIQWTVLDDLAAQIIEDAITIAQIPAPTFAEQQRAEYVASAFADRNLSDISTDSLFNVYGRLPGREPDLPAVMVTAHTDTVFPADTPLTVRREDERIYCPGLGDNSIGVAGMLALITALRHIDIQPRHDLWFVATSREEGLGDLGGMRAAFERLQPRVGCGINIEGLALGNIYHAGIAVRRLKITARTAGGHSWLHFGRPSAIHSLMQLGTRITMLPLPQTPRTTYNIGLIEGGQSINSIATQAALWLALRSEARKPLGALETRVRAEIAALSSDDIQFEVEVVGDRPAGQIAPDHPLVRQALAALEAVGIHGTLETGSTDGNIPLSHNCPTVTVGITRGGNAHRLDEFIDVNPTKDGLRQLILLTLAAADADS